jgi:hypothetical protein
MTIFFNIIFDFLFDFHWACLRYFTRPIVGAWLFACLMILFFPLASKAIFTLLHTQLGLPHPLTFSLLHCIRGQLLDFMKIHLLHCAQGGEKITSHDVVWDVFAFIATSAKFHILCE